MPAVAPISLRPVGPMFRAKLLLLVREAGATGLSRTRLTQAFLSDYGTLSSLEPHLAAMESDGLIERRVVPSGYLGRYQAVSYFPAKGGR